MQYFQLGVCSPLLHSMCIFQQIECHLGRKSEMPSPQVLQPVLKMKVDELFLNWLSEPNTQVVLKEYLWKIKNGDKIELCSGDSKDNCTSLLSENGHSPGTKSGPDRTSAPYSAASNPPSSTLPSGSGGLTRVGSNGRALRRSVSTKKVRMLVS